MTRLEQGKHHGHAHNEHCGHGHTHKHRLRNAVLRRISNPTMKAVTTAVFRGSSLLLCPGDDIAAATLIALNGDDHHSEMTGTLPPPPQIQQEVIIMERKTKRKIWQQDLGSLDDFVLDAERHGKHANGKTKEPSSTYSGRHRKTTTLEVQPKRTRKKRRTQVAVAASIVAAVGAGIVGFDKLTSPSEPIFVSDTPQSSPSFTFDLPRAETSIVPSTPTVVFEQVQTGDTQWEMVEKAVEQAGHEVSIPEVNVITDLVAYENRATIPDPELMHRGQTLAMPTEQTIDIIYDTLNNPAGNPALAADLYALNNSDAASKQEKIIKHDSVFKRITSHFSAYR